MRITSLMRFVLVILILSGLALFSANAMITKAQGEDCPALVRTALSTTQQVCDGTGRDQACYGNVLIDARPQTGFGPITFNNPGDIVDVAAIRSLQLSAMDAVAGVWGVSLVEVRANLPASKPENVTLLMFGDVSIENAVTPSASIDVTVGVREHVNVRWRPSEKSGTVGALKPGETVKAVGRLADNSWLQVRLPVDQTVGWVYAPLLTAGASLETLQVLQPETPHYEPLQAFYFTSGTDENRPCAEMPSSGLLIQTPEGAGKVNLLINEVNIRIGSTVFFQAQPGGSLKISTVEGAADVTVDGVTYTAYAGTFVTVPLGPDLHPAGPPTMPQPYDLAALQSLPVQLLPRQIVIHTPLDPNTINALVSADVNRTASEESNNGNGSGSETSTDQPTSVGDDGQPGNGTTDPSDDGQCCAVPGTTEPEADACPGNSCNAPGHDPNGPGESENAPGQNKDKDK